jgi:hypothetical protein
VVSRPEGKQRLRGANMLQDLLMTLELTVIAVLMLGFIAMWVAA